MCVLVSRYLRYPYYLHPLYVCVYLYLATFATHITYTPYMYVCTCISLPSLPSLPILPTPPICMCVLVSRYLRYLCYLRYPYYLHPLYVCVYLYLATFATHITYTPYMYVCILVSRYLRYLRYPYYLHPLYVCMYLYLATFATFATHITYTPYMYVCTCISLPSLPSLPILLTPPICMYVLACISLPSLPSLPILLTPPICMCVLVSRYLRYLRYPYYLHPLYVCVYLYLATFATHITYTPYMYVCTCISLPSLPILLTPPICMYVLVSRYLRYLRYPYYLHPLYVCVYLYLATFATFATFATHITYTPYMYVCTCISLPSLLLINPDKTKVLVLGTHKMLQRLPDDFYVTLLEKRITPTISARDLGIQLDSTLSFNEHIANTVSTCIASLCQINRVKHLFDPKILENVISSLVFSKLYYCSNVWSSTTKKNIEKLQKVQNFAARIITGTQKYEHITPILKQLNWLPVPDMLKYFVGVLTFKCLNGLAPDYLNSYFQERLSLHDRNTRNKQKLNFQPIDRRPDNEHLNTEQYHCGTLYPAILLYMTIVNILKVIFITICLNFFF